ncbi:MAG: ABC transporter ATP-binding protein [Alphaproteobacteria bacterium]|nr:ABC transporter ATP-binding protein [Alphaproteobacteria bacterium]
MSTLLEVEGLSRNFGGLAAVSGLGLDVQEREVFGIIGPNGAGKTTAINLISGVIKPSSGVVRFRGEAVTGLPPHRLVRKGLARTFQATTVYGQRSVYENCLRGAYLHLYPGFLGTFLHTAAARAMRAEADARIEEVLGWLGLTAAADTIASNLPYGAQKTLGLAIALVAQPSLVMLDEPAAGLSAEEADHVRDTIRRLRERGIAVVVIDHNMRFMRDICDRIFVMHHGQELARGTPDEVLSDPTVIQAYLGRAYAKPEA